MIRAAVVVRDDDGSKPRASGDDPMAEISEFTFAP